jgi:hypothetical protein
MLNQGSATSQTLFVLSKSISQARTSCAALAWTSGISSAFASGWRYELRYWEIYAKGCAVNIACQSNLENRPISHWQWHFTV